MQIAQLIFLILIWVWLVGIAGILIKFEKLAIPYVEAKLQEMKIFMGKDTDKSE